MAGEGFAAAPLEQRTGETFDERNQRTQQQMNQAKRPRQQHGQPIWEDPKQHLRQQIEKGVEEKDDDRKNDGEPNMMPVQGLVQDIDDPTENDEVGDRVADEDRP